VIYYYICISVVQVVNHHFSVSGLIILKT